MLSDKSFIEKIAKYDFISLIETWLPEGFNINIPGFFSMSKYRKKKTKKARRHSGGITVSVKNSLGKGIKFSSSKSDRFLWWKLDKAFFNLNDDVYICTVYIPPSNSSHHNQSLEYLFDELQYDIMKYSAKVEIGLNQLMVISMHVKDSLKISYNMKIPLFLTQAIWKTSSTLCTLSLYQITWTRKLTNMEDH